MEPLARGARRVRRHRTPRFAVGRPGAISAPGARERGNRERRTAIPDRCAHATNGSRGIPRSLCAQPCEPRTRATGQRSPSHKVTAARVCLRSCAQAANAALARTGPPSLVSGGHGRRPFRYPRARLTRLGAPRSRLQSTRLAMPGHLARGGGTQRWPLRGQWGRTRRGAARVDPRPRVCRLLPDHRLRRASLQQSTPTGPPPQTAESGWMSSPPPRPASCCFQHRGTGRPRLGPDSELCRRSTPFRCSDSTPLRSAVGKHRRQAIPPRRREHGSFRFGYVRERDCAYAEPGRPHCRRPKFVCPPIRAAVSLRLAACPSSRASLRSHPVSTPRTAEPRGPRDPVASFPAGQPRELARRNITALAGPIGA